MALFSQESEISNEASGIVHKIRGNPELIEKYSELVSQFTEGDWLYLLHHRPNSPGVVRRCDKWDQLNVDDLCDLMGRHSQLTSYCPDSVMRKFKRGHWAKLVRSDGPVFAAILEKLGLTDAMKGEWCCVHHWAEEYVTFFSARYAAASSREHKIERIAENSCMTPGFKSPMRYANDRVGMIRWLASVSQDMADMAAITDESHAEKYALIAEAALYQIRKLSGLSNG